MKKFTKILLGSILSVAMVVTGGLAFLNNNDAYAKSGITIDGYGMVSALTSGATVEYGTYAQPNAGTINYNVSANGHKEFTGIKLTGGKNAQFDLGTFDISNSAWAGNNNKAIAGNNNSFLEFVFQPLKMSSSSWKSEINKLTIRIIDQNDTSNYMDIEFSYYQDGDARYREMTLKAAATRMVNGVLKSQTLGCYRDEKTSWQTGTVRKGQIKSSDAKALGIGTTDCSVTPVGASTAPLMLYYDNNDNALFTPTTSPAASSTLGESCLIRDFDATEEVENNYAADGIWNGFTEDENGKKMVKAVITFTEMFGSAKTSSIVVTKIGDFACSNKIVNANDSKVVDGAYTYDGSITYGDYAQLTNGKIFRGLNVKGNVGDKFNLGTMSINDTYFDDNWTYVKGTGIVDAESGNLYTCTSKFSNPNFVGTDESIEGESSIARSFFSFVINPEELTSLEEALQRLMFTVTLTEVGKPENFVTYYITLYYSSDSHKLELLVQCTATNNSYVSAERFYKTTGITLTDNVRRVIDIAGNQSIPVSLYYDYSQQAAYTNVAFNGTNDGIYGAFRIRDFNDYSKTSSDYVQPSSSKLAGKTVNTWEGFSADAEVEITLEMMGLYNDNYSNSIVVTSLGGYDFNENVLTFNDGNALMGVERNLNDFVTFNSGKISHEYNADIISSYRFNDQDVVSPYVFTESGKLEYFDANGDKLGEVNVTVDENITINADITNGSYEIVREGEVVPGNTVKLGDVIKLIPGKEKVSQLDLTDMRYMVFGKKSYNYDTSAIADATNLPFDRVENNGEIYYTHTITVNDLESSAINFIAVFDRYCKITLKDTEKPEGKQFTTSYHWSTDGKYEFPLNTAFNGKDIARGSSSDKVLVAYARTDVAYKNAQGTFTNIRSDYKVANYNNSSVNCLTHYKSRPFGKEGEGVIGGEKTLVSIVPNMTFETIYVKIWIEAEIKLQSGKLNDYSGLRFVVKFDKAGVDNYMKYYGGSANATNNPFGTIHNYVTTQKTLNAAKGSEVDISTIGSSDWLNDGWASANVANNLSLVNGTGKTAAEMAGKYGYIYYSFSGRANIWNEKIISNDYYAYAITLNGFKLENIHKEYVFMPLINLGEVSGSATSFVVNAYKVTPSELAEKKLKEILKESADETDLDITIMEGETKYYSDYTLEDIQWLAKMAGSDRVFTAGEKVEQA